MENQRIKRSQRLKYNGAEKNFYVKSPEREITNGEESDETAEGEKRV